MRPLNRSLVPQRCLAIHAATSKTVSCIQDSFATKTTHLPRNGQCTDESTDDCSGSDRSEIKTSAVNLRISNLSSLHTLNEGPNQSVFASNGMDPERIKEVLKNPPCDCGCRMPYKILYRACQSFWQLGKEHQDACLWSLQQSSGRKTKWSIEGLLG